MIGNTRNRYSDPRNRAGFVLKRRPFWLPASNYYILAAAIGLALFFLAWGVLHDSGDETPWITAGIGFSIVMIGAVVLRELILRRNRARYLAQQREFDRHIAEAVTRIGEGQRSDKLTIERNDRIISDIKRKSEAAKVLNKFADAHREVFELCDQYLVINDRESRLIRTGSPRIRALRKGREYVSRFHRYHLLQWAKIETRNLTQDVPGLVETGEKVSTLQNALGVIDSALEFYPAERSLVESRLVLNEMLTTVKVSHYVEKAELSAFKGDTKQALSLYRDALFYLGRDNVKSEQRNAAAQRILFEIDRLHQLDS